MIVFELICAAHHRFEGWFASGEDFDRQRERGLLKCPVCTTDRVEKLLSAKIKKPAAASATKAEARTPQQEAASWSALLDRILANTEDVGRQFADEARRIHYEEAPRRSIRGVATRDETQELVDEGIPVAPLPIPPRGEWN